MDETKSLSHSKWECKYHVVFIPKCRRKVLYAQLRQHLGEVFRRTKNQSLNGSVNRNFSLLADPSMTLAYAKDEIVLTANGDEYKPGDIADLHCPGEWLRCDQRPAGECDSGPADCRG